MASLCATGPFGRVGLPLGALGQGAGSAYT
jgi:hypothetical protein